VEDKIKELKTNYITTFGSEQGIVILSDLEKRCHYNATTNVVGDSHESAYREGQRSVILFIKNMLLNNNEKGK
jgi:hypothetical protein